MNLDDISKQRLEGFRANGCFAKLNFFIEVYIFSSFISHPAILPMYVFAYDHKFYDSIPKNFKMNLFQRYMEEESKIGKQLLQLKNSIYFNLNFFKFSNLYSFKTK